MPDFPPQIVDYLIDLVAAEQSPAFILLDAQARVVQCGGQVDKYTDQPLHPGDAIADALVFMEGLLPLDLPRHRLPSVMIRSNLSVDVHVLKLPEGHAVLLLDVTPRDQSRRRRQQQSNESALALQKAGTPLAAAMADPPDESLWDFFKTINMAVLEYLPDGFFRPAAELPEWIERFCPDFPQNHTCTFDPGNYFSFLENFIDEARPFWMGLKPGCLKSGIWIESDDNGADYLFEATAANVGVKHLLLIQQDACAAIDKQQLIQKGRSLALNHHALARMQQALETAQGELEQRVTERTLALQSANQQLARELEHRKQMELERSEIVRQLQQSQKMEAIGTLAGGIAHDFNNILSAVIGFTELSIDESDMGTDQRHNLLQVLSAANRAKDLIRQILTFSRQTRQEPKPVQFNAIVAEVLKLMRATLPSTIEIEQRLESNAYVFADPTQLHQVVMNLCTNAGQALQQEGGLMRVFLTDLQVTDDLPKKYPELHPGPHIMLLVGDNGGGMTPEIMARIFDPFFTTKEKGAGTGMGLSVVHGIVKSCGGVISVDSRPGRGAEFRIFLPAVRDASRTDGGTREALPGGNERVLFVDDEPLQTELATQLLGRLGYEVVTLNDSLEALSRFRADPDRFDLVITDLTMPKMTGKVLAMELRKIRPDIPIILCSGYSEGLMTSEEADALGIRSYLMKPIAMHEMARTVRRVLDESSEKSSER